MKVKDLIEILKGHNPDAIVCLETFMDPQAQEVKGYVDGDEHYVYIGDDLDNITYELVEDYGFEEE